VLIDEDADHQHFEPAHRESDDPDHPQAAEIGARQHSPALAATAAFGAGEDGRRPRRRGSLAGAAKRPQQQLIQSHFYADLLAFPCRRLLLGGAAA
jgi:hypothetical protein